MTAIKLAGDSFSGSGKIWDKEKGLARTLRALAVDNARRVSRDANISAFTDNSTGTAGDGFVDIPSSFDTFNASSAGGVPVSGFNTALGKVRDAQLVIANQLNLYRTKLGLPVLTVAGGTEVTPGTIPALDKTLSNASGTSAASHASFAAAVKVVKANQVKLTRAFAELETAVGLDTTPSGLRTSGISGVTLPAIPAVTAAAASPNTISVANGDGIAVLVYVANNVATLAAKFATFNTSAKATSHGLAVVAG